MIDFFYDFTSVVIFTSCSSDFRGEDEGRNKDESYEKKVKFLLKAKYVALAFTLESEIDSHVYMIKGIRGRVKRLRH